MNKPVAPNAEGVKLGQQQVPTPPAHPRTVRNNSPVMTQNGPIHPPPAPPWADAVSRSLEAAAREGYLSARATAASYQHTLRTALACGLQRQFVRYVATLPCETLEQKQVVAKFVNYELSSLGLSLRCPSTGQSALLVADAGPKPVAGRFVFEICLTNGHRTRRAPSDHLPELELMPYDGSRDVKINWFDRVSGLACPDRGR